MKEAEICYRSNPNEPEIVCEARIFGAPSLFSLYKSKEEIGNIKNAKRDVLFYESERKVVKRNTENRKGQVVGNTQGSIKFWKSNYSVDFLTFIQENDKACVVMVLDYAGFTTNMSDLKTKTIPNYKKLSLTCISTEIISKFLTGSNC
ncbi:uncharacterized protein BX663DRAFT_544132 [Cokeromyces recurvatus]|uniref:uncharacterized protein n=1 Tax=Cokeromyces recurvatus TaxID=90255 RepID=UPI00221F24B1|nr:uncharacterized protein BX663DRAFT_544132 [Cokeromyces recurvatus]KAI7901360.1 hypothetical protein BX663DRAFT_544132 [Cokeromyces recurvatus]